MTLIDKENYRVDLEYNKDFAILHLPYVSVFTRDLYAESFVRIEEILEFMGGLGYNGLYAAVTPEDQKIQKLIDRLGFKYQGKADGLLVYHLKGN